MSPVYLNPQSSSPIPFLELKGDQQHSFFAHLHDDLATSNNNNSSFSFNSHNRHNSEEILSLGYSRHEQQKARFNCLSSLFHLYLCNTSK